MDEDFTNPSPQGDDGNENENQRNCHQLGSKSQHQSKQSLPKSFMSPTISAATKAQTLKKNILDEFNENSQNAHQLKPTNLGSKPISHQVGISKSGSRTPLPKVEKSDVNGDGGKRCVDDESCIKPYDPISNYLSPRPKFLRYNPHRRRRMFLESVASPTGSFDSQDGDVYCTEESCLMQESEEKEDVDDEEEATEGRKEGLKWELFKFLIVFVVLVVSTMFISSMNSHLPFGTQGKGGFEVESLKLGNRTSREVSLRGFGFDDWITVGREESEMGRVEIEGIGVECDGKLREDGDQLGYDGVLEIEAVEAIGSLEGSCVKVAQLEGHQDDCQLISESLKEGQVDSRISIAAQVLNKEIEVGNVVLESISKDELVVNEVQNDASYFEETVEGEKLADFAGKMVDSGQKSNHCQFSNETEIVAEVSEEGIEEGNVTDLMKVMDDSKQKSEECSLENESKVVADEPNDRIEEGNLAADYEKEIIECELEIEAENVVGYEHKPLRMTSKKEVWFLFLISSVITLVASFVVRFYNKCKKASSMTNSPNVKKCSQLPLKEEEAFEQILKADSCSSPSTVIPSREVGFEKIPPRVIPRVEVLSEFAVGDFQSSLKICTKQSMKHENEGSCHSVSQERRVQRTNSGRSGFAPSRPLSYTKADSEEMRIQENDKEEMMFTPTPSRRSNRIRNRVVTYT